MRRQRSSAVLGLIGGALLLASPAQAAAPVDNSSFGPTTEAFAVGCGPNYTGSSTFSGNVLVTDTNPSLQGQFFRLTSRIRFTDTITNIVTGETVTATGHFVFKELQPRSTDGRVFEYIGQDVGSIVFTNSAGQVLLRESGRVTTSFLFDTLGDSAPGGTGLRPPQLESISGPHPTFDESFDFCAFLDDSTA